MSENIFFPRVFVSHILSFYREFFNFSDNHPYIYQTLFVLSFFFSVSSFFVFKCQFLIDLNIWFKSSKI